jgi:cytochrome-b5 reductase
MIAGGAGIAGMLQIIQEVVLNDRDTTSIHLLYSNLDEQDILLME